jgi:lysophospholipase L1-like esterase
MKPVVCIAIAAALTVFAGASGGSDGGQTLPGCLAPPSLLAIEPVLTHVAARIENHEPLTIVAIGSSSTQGVGASAPTLSYPSRLEAELRQRLPQLDIRVINRGKGGEDAPEELARLERDVIAERPDLVIWQIGTNAVLRREDQNSDGEALRRGIALLQQNGSDVILMDMQYAPRVTARPAHSSMKRLIADTAERARVGLFRRFDIMRHWYSEQPQPEAAPAIGSDGLHMTDRGYACLAAGLAEAITRNWRDYGREAHGTRTARYASMVGAADLAGGDAF